MPGQMACAVVPFSGGIMSQKEKNEQAGMRRISWMVWGILVVLTLLLVSAFVRAWQVNQALEIKIATLAPMLTAEVETQATLQAELTRVQSEAYVEQWAQEHAKMVQGSEVLVIPITPTPTLTPTPRPTPTPTPTPLPFWQQWWRSLTGKGR